MNICTYTHMYVRVHTHKCVCVCVCTCVCVYMYHSALPPFPVSIHLSTSGGLETLDPTLTNRGTTLAMEYMQALGFRL